VKVKIRPLAADTRENVRGGDQLLRGRSRDLDSGVQI